LGGVKTEIFLQKGLDTKLPDGQITGLRREHIPHVANVVQRYQRVHTRLDAPRLRRGALLAFVICAATFPNFIDQNFVAAWHVISTCSLAIASFPHCVSRLFGLPGQEDDNRDRLQRHSS
jgi:hypothetical protein